MESDAEKQAPITRGPEATPIAPAAGFMHIYYRYRERSWCSALEKASGIVFASTGEADGRFYIATDAAKRG